MNRTKTAQAKIDTKKEIDDQLAGAKRASKARRAVRAMAPLLEQDLMQYMSLQKKIEAAFGGKVFLLDEPPTSVKNIRRFRTYIDMRKSATTIIVKLTHELMQVHRIDTNHPHDMREAPTFAGGIGASGLPVGLPTQPVPDGQRIPRKSPARAVSTRNIPAGTALARGSARNQEADRCRFCGQSL